VISPVSRARLGAVAAVSASALAFRLCARIDWPWLVLDWVGLVPWLAVLDRTKSLREALASGLLMSLAFVLLLFGWFPSAIQNYSGGSWVLALLLLVLLAPLLEPQFVTFAVARHLAQERAQTTDNRAQSGSRGGFWRTALLGACVYVGTEWAIPKLFADTLGHGLYPSALMRQAADIAGAHGLTFVLIVANECVLAMMRVASPLSHSPPLPEAATGERTGLRAVVAPMGCVIALVVGLLVYGTVRIQQLRGDGRRADVVTAGVVQADMSQYGRLATELGTFEAVRRILDAHFALSAEALDHGGIDVLVWPETVYPTTFGAPKSEDGAAFDREIGAFVTGAGVPLVFGAYDVEGGDEYNAAVFLEPAADGRVTFDAYHKASLFPLTERVPSLLDSSLVRHWLPWLGTWKPGHGARVLSLTLRDGRRLRIAPLICYDAIDPSHAIQAVRDGAELIVTLSNDSWFAYEGVPRLILVLSAFRSIETRRPQVRATTTGVSAIITPTGEFLGTIGVHERAALVAAVTPQRRAWTLMLAWGDWFGPTALACAVGLLAATRASRNNSSRRKCMTERESMRKEQWPWGRS